jgi:hypothetical protein
LRAGWVGSKWEDVYNHRYLCQAKQCCQVFKHRYIYIYISLKLQE